MEFFLSTSNPNEEKTKRELATQLIGWAWSVTGRTAQMLPAGDNIASSFIPTLAISLFDSQYIF